MLNIIKVDKKLNTFNIMNLLCIYTNTNEIFDSASPI